MLIYESKTFFGILVSINILDMNISKEILLIVVLLSIYIIDGVIKNLILELLQIIDFFCC